jgi:hypothetical protein
MAPTPSLTSLAQRLLERAVEFDKSPPTDDGIQSQDLKVARTEVLEALHEIQMRVQGPVDLLEGHQIHVRFDTPLSFSRLYS